MKSGVAMERLDRTEELQRSIEGVLAKIEAQKIALASLLREHRRGIVFAVVDDGPAEVLVTDGEGRDRPRATLRPTDRRARIM
jgi:hypothetical protein